MYSIQYRVLGNSLSYTLKRRQGRHVDGCVVVATLTHSYTHDTLFFTYIALVTFRFESCSNAFLN